MLDAFQLGFHVCGRDDVQGPAGADFVVNTLKAKTVAIIDDRTAYGQGVAEEFEKGVKAAGGKTVAREFTNDKATDFTAILTSLKAKKPDIVFFGGMDAVAGPMLKQMKQLGIKAKFMGGDGICSSGLVDLAGDGMSDEQVLFLGDIFPTGFMAAENANIQPGDTVAIWGCGPVSQFAIQSAWMLGAGRVIAIDRFPERLRMATHKAGATDVINYEQQDVRELAKDVLGDGSKTRVPSASPRGKRPAAGEQSPAPQIMPSVPRIES